MDKLLCILGPTATGKTDLALTLAKKFNSEIISCDSRQVYKGLDIGTGKLPTNVIPEKARLPDGQTGIHKSHGSRIKYGMTVEKGDKFWEVDGIKIWMYDVLEPSEQYDVAAYIKDAGQVIKEVIGRGKSPILVGGTGFYLRAFLDGLSNLKVPINRDLRKELESVSLLDLQKKLQVLSVTRWNELNNSDRQNKRRLLRCIEMMLWRPDADNAQIAIPKPQNWDVLKIGLTAPREVLYQRVDLRILSRIDQGMLQEAEMLYKEGLSLDRMRELGLEYRVLADYLDGSIKETKELIRIMQWKIHDFVRRQLTWYKKEKNINWFDINNRSYFEKIDKIVAKWYDSPIIKV